MQNIYVGGEIYAIINVVDDTGQHVDPDSWEAIKVYGSDGLDTGWIEKNGESPNLPDKVGSLPGVFRPVFTGLTLTEGENYTIGIQVTVGGTAYTQYGLPVTIVGVVGDISVELEKVPKRDDATDTYKQLRDAGGTILQEVKETLSSTEQII